jgi:two-component system, OmpR family, response regulator MprA
MKRVLLVDDDPDILSAIAAILEESYELVLAGDGLEALRAVGAGGIDAIVLDLMMPRLDGATFLRELRARGVSLPVLLMSAHPRLAERVADLGAAGGIAKPFDATELEEKLARIVKPGTG